MKRDKMVVCNRERVKTIESEVTVISEEPVKSNCQQNLSNADIIDYRTKMDTLSFYEKADFDPCDDLMLISNEECLWQCIVGEVKTPYGDLRNSVGQSTYGCRIWNLIGENVDSLMIKEFKSYIIETCLKYPEVNNDIKVGNKNIFFCAIKIDSVYGVFDGSMRIPFSYPSNVNWKDADSSSHA